jgi:hypothetical protein
MQGDVHPKKALNLVVHESCTESCAQQDRDEILSRLLALNHARAAEQSSAEGTTHNSLGRKAQVNVPKTTEG